jgi:hypothetical protein
MHQLERFISTQPLLAHFYAPLPWNRYPSQERVSAHPQAKTFLSYHITVCGITTARDQQQRDQQFDMQRWTEYLNSQQHVYERISARVRQEVYCPPQVLIRALGRTVELIAHNAPSICQDERTAELCL